MYRRLEFCFGFIVCLGMICVWVVGFVVLFLFTIALCECFVVWFTGLFSLVFVGVGLIVYGVVCLVVVSGLLGWYCLTVVFDCVILVCVVYYLLVWLDWL